VSVTVAVDAFLSTLDHPETAGTRRVYAGTLEALRTHLGPAAPLVVLEDPTVVAGLVAWFGDRWANAAPATFNRHLDTLRSAIGYWRDQDWLVGEPTRALRRRGRAPDRTRALDRKEITDLLGREDIALREKTLWRMLYESAARAGEVLALDVENLDQRNRCAKVRRKGNAVDVIVWQTGTARLLPRLLKGRPTGPVFLTDRRARVVLAPGDVYEPTGQARLSYRRAAELFTEATGGATLHQLRHSALTHAAEDGANTSTLLSFSGHTSVASLARYSRVSPEALRRWQQQRDPTSRRR
jgi:integrase/recombinase XerC/integrase/recombinase XerD